MLKIISNLNLSFRIFLLFLTQVINIFIEALSFLSIPFLINILLDIDYNPFSFLSGTKLEFINYFFQNNLFFLKVVFLIFLLKFIITILNLVFENALLKHISKKLSFVLANKFLSQTLLTKTDIKKSELLNLIAREVESFRIYLKHSLIFLRDILLLIIFVFTSFFISIKFTILISVIVILIYIIIFKRIFNYIAFLGKNILKLRTNILNSLDNIYESFIELVSFKVKDLLLNNFIREISKKEKYVYVTNIISNSLRPTIEIIVVALFFIFLIDNYDVLRSNKSQNLFVISTYAVIFIRLYPLVNSLSLSYGKIKLNSKAVEIIRNNICDKSIKTKDIKDNKFKNLRIHNLSFSYNKKSKIFDNLNLNINAGDKILIEGKSGSGKSTLLKIIVGMILPSHGKIKVNDKSIKKINYFKFISYINQNPFIFNDTYLNNITLFNRIDDHSFLKDIVKKLKLIETLNLKKYEDLEKILNKDKISGGQRQLIAICRALFFKRQILILDESTNSIDKKLEKQIFNYLFKLNELTLINVSHSPIYKNRYNHRYVFKDQ